MTVGYNRILRVVILLGMMGTSQKKELCPTIEFEFLGCMAPGLEFFLLYLPFFC